MKMKMLLRKVKNSCVVLLILAVVLLQILPLGATAQQLIEARQDMRQGIESSAVQSKLAPDLEDDLRRAEWSDSSDPKVPVIIQLRSATRLGEAGVTETMSTGKRDELFATEVRINQMRAPVMRAKIASLNGRLNRALTRLGLITAELPMSKIREMEKDPEVAYISPDRAVESYGHIESTVGAGYGDGRTEAANLSNCNGTGVGIAVLDSGIDDTHNLTKATPTHTGLVYSKTYTNNAANRDYYGHGTHVASIIAGDNLFKNGAYTGIAYEAKLISLAVLDSQGKGVSSNVVAAMDWCIANKATYNIRVINCSFGTPAKDSYTTDPLCLAARRAHNAGIVVVASAGNYGKNSQGHKLYGSISSPGIEPSVITVGALNTYGTDLRSDDVVASYSSRGPVRSYKVVAGIKKYDNLIKPDIVAPGNKLVRVTAL
jgi:serine protease AprX